MKHMKRTETTIDPEQAFPEVEKMLYSLAWATSNKYHVPFEEVQSEAYFLFMKACQNYKPSKGKFSSWCYLVVSMYLRTFITKRAKDRLTFVEEVGDDLMSTAQEHEAPELIKLSEGATSDAREIISLLVETPKELVELAGVTPRQFMKKVKEYLIQKGRSAKEVDQARKELLLVGGNSVRVFSWV